MPPEIRLLQPDDVPWMHALLTMFGEAFHERDTYSEHRPSDRYLRELLESESFLALAALQDGLVIGGIAAYVLRKFEQARSEVYIYDLAVAASHRRQGVATLLIEALKPIAAARGAYIIFVQADTGEEDLPAIGLYSKLGRREDVLHFDIEVHQSPGSET